MLLERGLDAADDFLRAVGLVEVNREALEVVVVVLALFVVVRRAAGEVVLDAEPRPSMTDGSTAPWAARSSLVPGRSLALMSATTASSASADSRSVLFRTTMSAQLIWSSNTSSSGLSWSRAGSLSRSACTWSGGR